MVEAIVVMDEHWRFAGEHKYEWTSYDGRGWRQHGRLIADHARPQRPAASQAAKASAATAGDGYLSIGRP